jgi:hypothetical protein
VITHPGVVDADPGRGEVHCGILEALPVVKEAHPGVIEANLVGEELNKIFKTKKVYFGEISRRLENIQALLKIGEN